MGTIYHFNELTKLEFQLDFNDVLLSLEMTQNNVKNETSFQISHSELNKIIGGGFPYKIRISRLKIPATGFLQ